jgi:hypothetical protein
VILNALCAKAAVATNRRRRCDIREFACVASDRRWQV